MDLLKACGGQNFQFGVPSWWNKGKKGVACSNILWMMPGSFSPDDSCVVRRSEMNLEKAKCLYLSTHEGSWLNWKATQRGCDQVKHVPHGHGNRNLIMKKKWGGLLHACQIVIHLDVLLFFRIVLGHDFCRFMRNVLGLEDIVF